MNDERYPGEHDGSLPLREREILDQLLDKLSVLKSLLFLENQKKEPNFLFSKPSQSTVAQSRYLQRSIRGEDSMIGEINRRLEDIEELIQDLEGKRRMTGIESFEFLEHLGTIAETTETAIHALIELEDQIQGETEEGEEKRSDRAISDSLDSLIKQARAKRLEILLTKRTLLRIQHDLMRRFLQWQADVLSTRLEQQCTGPAIYLRCLHRLGSWKEIQEFPLSELDEQIPLDQSITLVDAEVNRLSEAVDVVFLGASESIYQIHQLLEPYLDRPTGLQK